MTRFRRFAAAAVSFAALGAAQAQACLMSTPNLVANGTHQLEVRVVAQPRIAERGKEGECAVPVEVVRVDRAPGATKLAEGETLVISSRCILPGQIADACTPGGIVPIGALTPGTRFQAVFNVSDRPHMRGILVAEMHSIRFR